jgi:hypothetical protein
MMGRCTVALLVTLGGLVMASCSREPTESSGKGDKPVSTRVNATDDKPGQTRVVTRPTRTRQINETEAAPDRATTPAVAQTTATPTTATAAVTTATTEPAPSELVKAAVHLAPEDAPPPERVKPGEPIPTYAKFRETIAGMRQAAAAGLSPEQKDQLLVIKDNLHFETIKVRPMNDREELKFFEQTADLERLYEEAANGPDAETRQAALDKIMQILQDVENTLQQPQNP